MKWVVGFGGSGLALGTGRPLIMAESSARQ